MAQTVTVTRPDGQTYSAYLAEPAGGGAGVPGVVVIQEWWGLNDQIRGVANRLAEAGFVALVPDLYRGKSAVEAEEAHHLMTGLNFGEAASQDIRGAVQFLKARCPKVGVTGYCMGGALTVLTLTMAPEADAGVDALEAKLAEAGVAYTGHRYLAYHGFANETAQGPGRIEMTQYDARWAQAAWDRTVRFFGRHLG